MRYETVLFDADMTLLNFDEDEKTAFFATLRQHDIPCEEGTYALYHAINDGLWKEYEQNRIPKEQIGAKRFSQLCETLSIPADGILLNRDYMYLLSQTGTPAYGAVEVCERLCRSGCRLYIITNGTDFIQKKRLAKSGLMRYIEYAFISDCIGFQKPQREYFDYVFAHIPQKDKRQILIVGDSPTSDIAGGTAAGVDTCLLTNGKAFSPSPACRPTYTVKTPAEAEMVVRG